MKDGFRQSMAWLHTWVGLLVGWLLFFVFLTGTLGYVNNEIERWMRVEQPMISAPLPVKTLLPVAYDRLLTHAVKNAKSWYINFPGGHLHDEWQIGWRSFPEAGERRGELTREILDPKTGKPIEDIKVRATGGGYLLYRMHYKLHYFSDKTAYWIVGICSMFMLIAIISGIITHKKIFKDFFTFRPKKGQRSWLDAHNILGVTALPFHLMITYSGLVFLMFTYTPIGLEVIYGEENEDLFFEEAYGNNQQEKIEIMPAANTAPLLPMLAIAEQHWGQNNIGSIDIDNPGRINAEVSFTPRYSQTIVRSRMYFNGVTGALIEKDGANFASQTENVLLGLHEGLFAGPLLRIFYVISGLGGTAMIGTGLLLWSTKRKAKLTQTDKKHFGIEVVDRLNLGTIVGLPIAIAAYFWANRLIPVDFADRQAWEAHTMYIAWAVMFIYPIWRPLNKGWFEMLSIAAAAYALIPIVNFLTTDKHLGATIAYGDWVLAGFDIMVFLIGVCFALIALKMYKKNAVKIYSNFSPLQTQKL